MLSVGLLIRFAVEENNFISIDRSLNEEVFDWSFLCFTKLLY